MSVKEKKPANRFKRSARTAGRNTKDEQGRVSIRVVRLARGSGNPAKGNISRSLTLQDAKVSDVFGVIDKMFTR